MAVLPDTARPESVFPVLTDLCCEVTSPSAGIIVLGIHGEVDLRTVGLVEDAVRTVLRRNPAYLVVDLAGMSFCGLHGLALFVQAAADAAERGVGFFVCGASAQAVRVWSALWAPAEQLAHHPDAAAGVRAAYAAGSGITAGKPAAATDYPGRRVDRGQ